MKLRLALSIAIAKLAIKLCRLVRWGGTTLPGRLAQKVYPGVLKDIARNFSVIMVTGTNGKTTTTRIIGQILNENNVDYITNRSGANLVGGITTTFIEAVNLKGVSPVSIALIEVDEAAFKVITDFMEPDILVVTNFFRDQLDRFGELYSILNKVAMGIQKSPKTRLVLNADDSLCSSLAKETDSEVIYYGFGRESIDSGENVNSGRSTESRDILNSGDSLGSDAAFCIYCKSKYEYSLSTYGHLGHFKCPECGYQRPDSHITCTKVEKLTGSCSEIQLFIPVEGACEDATDMTKGGVNTADNIEDVNQNTDDIAMEAAISQDNSDFADCPDETCITVHGPSGQVYNARINLPGLYNIYNALAAAACGYALGLPSENTVKALGNFKGVFGRMEIIKTSGKAIKVILVKNPTGFDQVLDFLLTEEDNMQLAFLINDKAGDGTDISWLWDVAFEKLQAVQDKFEDIYISGTRAEDMAVRLKYAGIYTDKVSIIKDYNQLINTALSRTLEGNCFYIFPTYTAMLDIRKILRKKFNLKEFWK